MILYVDNYLFQGISLEFFSKCTYIIIKNNLKYLKKIWIENFQKLINKGIIYIKYRHIVTR